MQNETENNDTEKVEKRVVKDRRGINTTFYLVLAIVMVVAIAAFVIYFQQTSGVIKNKDNNILSLESQVSSLQSQISSTNSQITALQGQVSAYQSQISIFDSKESSYKSQISTLQSQFSSTTSQVSGLQSQVSLLQSQNDDLQGIVNLSKSSIKTNPITITQPASSTSLVVTFLADYAGYIVVSGTSTTLSGYLQVTNSYPGYPYNSYTYYFGTSKSVLVPILPGTINVYFANSNTYGTATTTLTVVYYY